MLHALSTLELTLDTQLDGLRTLLFPARFDTRRDFTGWLVDRPQLARLSNSVYKLCPLRNVYVPEAKSFSQAKFSLLKAVNDIESHAAKQESVPPPTIGEIVPTFLWQAASTDWTAAVIKERSGGLAYALYAADGAARSARMRTVEEPRSDMRGRLFEKAASGQGSPR